MMSLCAFHADRCHGDRLYFMNNGPCKTDAGSLDWAKFRANVSEQSSVREPCGSDTCYEWETCSGTDLITNPYVTCYFRIKASLVCIQLK